MTSLDEFFTKIRPSVDTCLDELIPNAAVEPSLLHQAIRWSVFGGGKRIRPAILLAVGESFGSLPEQLMRSAAAVEMIHTYSLIHDDLPAMDDDDLRRGRATCHKRFGDATAILAGDVLQTLAFKAISDDVLVPAEVRVNLISLLADASGTPHGMVAGQQLDLDGEGKDLSIDQIEKIHRKKTGALISAAAIMGATIGAASHKDLVAVKNYAEKLGLLFQITDDLLDVTQSTVELGKTAGKDTASAKATYPGHSGVENTLKMADAVRGEAHRALGAIRINTNLLGQFVEFVFSRTN